MDAEAVEKKIEELKGKISNEQRKGQVKMQQYNKLGEELKIGAGLIQRWKIQMETYEEMLEK